MISAPDLVFLEWLMRQEMKKREIWISNVYSRRMSSSETTEQTDTLTYNKLLWQFSNNLGKIKFCSFIDACFWRALVTIWGRLIGRYTFAGSWFDLRLECPRGASESTVHTNGQECIKQTIYMFHILIFLWEVKVHESNEGAQTLAESTQIVSLQFIFSFLVYFKKVRNRGRKQSFWK